MVGGLQKMRMACVQMNSGADMELNRQAMLHDVEQAKSRGCDWVAFPENAGCMEEHFEALKQKAYPEAVHPVLQTMRQAAKDQAIWISIGSLAMPVQGSEKLHNRGYIINPAGDVVTHYNKVHLFDADMTRHGDGRPYRESDRYLPGDMAKLVATPWGGVGVSICYDVRFAYLYRALAHAGAKMMLVPAAFARVTGELHWHTLLRARAIEHGCYVVAPAQCGEHPGHRKTYGHALVIDPMGRVLADAGADRPGMLVVDLDMQEVEQARYALPCLQHDRVVVVERVSG